jgi:hypothetical protein
MVCVLNIAKKINARCQIAWKKWSSPEPVRPIVLIQSDDWGRAGLPDIESLDALKQAGAQVGHSAWDFYGLESEDDLHHLGNVLSQHKDIDGNPACLTANIVMANADFPRMKEENFSQFRYVSIDKGFPAPWKNFNILASYKELISKGVFYPALHGFTHFSPKLMLDAWHDQGNFGRNARLLFQRDIPYLASLTPEFNFALLRRNGRKELFATEAEQRLWIGMGVKLFQECFGILPLSTCAPGYRANELTYQLWAEHGIRVAQTASGSAPYVNHGLLFIPRTVFFEPALNLNASQVVAAALGQANAAIAQGKAIVICSHSINYIQRHLGKREESLNALDLLLTGLLKTYPNLRFANDQMVFDAWNRQDRAWFLPAKLASIVNRNFS